MKGNQNRAAGGRTLVAVTVMLIVISIFTTSAAAQSYKVLFAFSGADGQEPMGRLISDGAGNLYGMTRHGGTYGQGTVFKLTSNPDGTWTESVLHSFAGHRDGAEPIWSSPAFDKDGKLFGTTSNGGHGYGTVFMLAPNPDGTWTESILHRFKGGKDGAYPMTTPVFDKSGSLYATTVTGTAGTVFRLIPNPDGSWTYRVLHHFKGGKDGDQPWSGLVFDTAGNLYGTTRGGGLTSCGFEFSGCGTVFQLIPGPADSWAYRVLHRFRGGKGGFDPSISGLVFDDAGGLYGTTEYGGKGDCNYWGNPGCGTLFEMTPGPDNKWTFQVSYRFKGGKTGGDPFGVIFDASGNLYGTTVEGGHRGCDGHCGTVYKLTPNPDGGWIRTVLYRFLGGEDGGNPNSGLLLDGLGNIYGTAQFGGAYGLGVVYQITP